jgi:hypothetical protein
MTTRGLTGRRISAFGQRTLATAPVSGHWRRPAAMQNGNVPSFCPMRRFYTLFRRSISPAAQVKYQNDGHTR